MKKHQNNVFVSRAPRRALTRALLLGSLLAAGVLSTSATAQEGDERDDGPVVQTSEGPVRGFVRDGVYEFLGIPYAAPPVGALRWMPPQPVAHWRKPLKATKFANTCAQVTELGVFAGPPNINEDCLYLNVFTTRVGGAERGNAVLVWIHGGGNVDGESNDYDGSKLATGGPLGTPTVVVTLNYRMGLFGFLAHPALDSEGHLYDNYGIMDQQAVLQWVKRNAAAFGGDPSRVALGGQSAGAQDTGVNQISPLSAGLFNRAIYESSPLSGITIRSIGLARGMAFATAAGCPTDASPGAAACLRALSAAEILQLQGTPNVTGPYVTGPMLDGTIMPITPITAWRTGQFNRMPIMGRNVQVDRLWAKWVPVYEYEFNDQNAPYYFPPLPGFKPLAAHTIDIQFLFPNWHGGVLGVNHPATLTTQETALSDELVAAWTHFASTGNPNGTGNSPWPQYSEAANAAAVLSENVPSLSTFTLAQWSANHNCDLWTGDTLDPITGNTGGILHFQ